MKLAALLLLFASLSAGVERAMKRDGVPGAAAVVVKDGRVIKAAAFGVASSEAMKTLVLLSPAALAAIEAYAPLRDIEVAKTPLPLSRESIASIAGKYTNGAFSVELAADGDNLVVRIGGKSRFLCAETWALRKRS